MRCCWVESVSRGKEKDKCSLKIAPGQLVYTVYQQSVPGAKEGVREGGGWRERERETEDGCKRVREMWKNRVEWIERRTNCSIYMDNKDNPPLKKERKNRESKSQIEKENKLSISEREKAKDGECLPVPVVNALEVTVEG